MQKIINKLKQNKIILILILFSITSIVYLYYRSKPTLPVIINQSLNNQYLTLMNFDPPPGEFESVWNTQAISFTFDQELDLGSLDYVVVPIIDTVSFLNPDNKTIYIRPKKDWRPNINYKITLKKLFSSNGNYLLEKWIEYQFKINKPDFIITD